MTKTVHLGFAVGSGEPVEIPVAHMIVTGQTQAAGKTTALEALVQRSGVRALAFRTKRGEGAFETSGTRVLPYFRERADWRFVSAILEASIGERMKFERSWIMRATKGAKTLADVRRNVRELGAKAKGGMSADMFMMLGEYLDGVIPELARVTFASKVDLRPGANVVDLCDISVNVQGLVISSMLQWVHDRERGVVAVLPEAWKFIPQGRNSPVRMAAIAYAREGGTLGNLIWLDSQDLAGAEKEVVRAASVYLLGVQREANEIKRTLDHIPAGVKKPKAAELATLKLGQFFACWGEHVVRTYVQPAWLPNEEAQNVAINGPGPLTFARWKKERAEEVAPVAFGGKFEDLDPRPMLATMRTEKMPDRWPVLDEVKAIPVVTIKNIKTEEDEMSKEDVEAIRTEVQEMGKTIAGAIADLGVELARPRKVTNFHGKLEVPADADKEPRAALDEEAMYQRILARLKKEAPALLKILTLKPSMEITVETYVLEVDGKTLKGKLAEMISQHWFDEPKVGNAAYNELQRRGFGTAKPNVYRELDVLAGLGFLTKETDGYQVVKDMKVNIKRR